MNAVEIEEAVSELASQPFDSQEFAFLFLEAFGNKATTIKNLHKGNTNKSIIDGDVLQRNNIHIAVADWKSQSMTLRLMMDFFNENGISPTEHLGPRMETLENRISVLIKKRMNGMIAIMKDIEKSQTKPTVAMMQALFPEAEQRA